MKVLGLFKDTDGRTYNEGDVYPHKDAQEPTKERIEQLTTSDNKCGRPFLEHDQINLAKLKKAELLELASEKKLEVSDSLTKDELIEKLKE